VTALEPDLGGAGHVALALESLVVHRGAQRVLDGVDLAVRTGEILGVSGPSGAGKTTLLHAIAGLVPVSFGRVLVDGDALESSDPRMRAERVGLVFQDHQLFPHLDVFSNVALALRVRGEVSRDRVLAVLAELGVEELADRSPTTLSGGQRQRVAIARACVLAPRVLLLDEPTASLDGASASSLSTLVRRIAANAAVLVVSHDAEFVRTTCTRALIATGGRLVERP
jgi:ABC-type sulfate/molybdate transport systems ATPase subunit